MTGSMRTMRITLRWNKTSEGPGNRSFLHGENFVRNAEVKSKRNSNKAKNDRCTYSYRICDSAADRAFFQPQDHFLLVVFSFSDTILGVDISFLSTTKRSEI